MKIYLDHAATTYVREEVLKTMLPYFSEIYGNPHSLHNEGKKALIALDKAREGVAEIFNCRESEVIFTGGATEANNIVIFGVAKANIQKGKHIIISSIEHPSISEPCKELEREGWEITRLRVNEEGLIDLQQLENSIRPDTILVSIIHANNEIGTIQNLEKISEICQKKKVIFHSDACQSACSMSMDTKVLNLDLMTINGSKIYGPKGIGALYVKRGTKITKINYGGDQEANLRPGTQNIPAIVGLAKALEIAQKNREAENKRLLSLREKLIKGILEIKDSQLNGHKTERLPNNIHVSFKGINGQNLLLQLDQAGVYVSAGSACKMGSNEDSEVLKAIGLPKNLAQSSIRLSIGLRTTEKEIDYTIKVLSETITKLRENKFAKA